jgi:hypothetical protein
MIPPRIFKIRSIWAGVWEMTFIGAGMYIFSKDTTSCQDL